MRLQMIWIVGAASIMIGGCSGNAPDNLGLAGGRLRPCPDSPNCVCSMDQGRSSHIAPYRYAVDRDDAEAKLRKIIHEQAGATNVRGEDGYLHVVFRSRLLGFVDDVEFYFPEAGKQVEIRSASRVGWWDMGVNRKRMERLCSLFAATIRE